MKSIYGRVTAFLVAAYVLIPELVLAAGGKADMLINVADTRRVQSPYTKFFLDTYNTDPFMFGVYCAIMTAFLGVALGLITDFFMKRTGIDLSHRKIVEH
ncbi:MAG: DVU0150 family protein [Thermodesulfobacteriota bacterium]